MNVTSKRLPLFLTAVLVLALAVSFAAGCKNKEAPASTDEQAKPTKAPPAPTKQPQGTPETAQPAAAAPVKTPVPAPVADKAPDKPLNDWSVAVTEITTGSDTAKKIRTLEAFEKEGVVTLMAKPVTDKTRATTLAALVKGSDWAQISGYGEGEVTDDPIYEFVITVKGRDYTFRRNRLDGSAVEILRLLQFFLN